MCCVRQPTTPRINDVCPYPRVCLAIHKSRFGSVWLYTISDYCRPLLRLHRGGSAGEYTCPPQLWPNRKPFFCRHGLPEVNLTVNGRQFISQEYSAFLNYGIEHITSSPYWPQRNGKAESAVKIVKACMKNSDDWQLALLHHRNTPPQGLSLSPAQRTFGRRTRHILPATKSALSPSSHSSRIVQAEIAAKREAAKAQYDKHVTLDLEDFVVGDYAYAKPASHKRTQAWLYCQVIRQEGPRSFLF